MKVLIITSGCNPQGGAFSLRVHSLSQMAAQSVDLSILSLYDPHDPKIPGVKFYYQSFPENLISKIKRTTNYYRVDYPAIKLENDFDIIQIEHPNLFGLAKQFPNTPKILDEHNVWWLLEEYNIQQAPTIKHLPLRNTLFKWFLKRAKKYELKILKESDHIITCSMTDLRIMMDESADLADKISYIPNCVDIKRYDVEKSSRKIVLYMGSLIYYPNIDALRLICRHIAPNVDAEFHILGEGSVDFTIPPNVKLLGRVDDVRPYIKKAKVCIAPLRYGSGSRLKILEYMAIGKATVTTTKGMEGLGLQSGKEIIVEDDINKFAASITMLLDSDELCEKLGNNARQAIEKKYDYRLYVDALKNIYMQLHK